MEDEKNTMGCMRLTAVYSTHSGAARERTKKEKRARTSAGKKQGKAARTLENNLMAGAGKCARSCDFHQAGNDAVLSTCHQNRWVSQSIFSPEKAGREYNKAWAQLRHV